ncbi:hypothetical protein ACONUD_02405 [Microbulbifer harenosus]|uniref:Uncharacterized protein n=1 Tax=Microbulbifer harenosus TaxID=2576840 RepID=A0ABY2UCR8_9GAMM|nr:hypothetical protein [Microbulbifer harenosus]TLM73626.1 hypothetical protein FDY93_18865 [Microbulbifer harenosus]
MLLKLLNWVAVKIHRKRQQSIDWKSLLDLLTSELDGFKYYLDTRKNGLVELESGIDQHATKDVLGIVATVSKKYQKPFETREPVERALKQLCLRSELSVHMMVSRNPGKFLGYYLYIRNNA